MQVLSEKQFACTRSKDTCAVFGSGWSINTITEPQWEFIKTQCDTITFNWFCIGTPFVPKYYCINAQGIRQKEVGSKYDHKNFLEKLKCQYAVVLTNRLKKNNDIVFHYDEHLDLIPMEGVVIPQGGYKETNADLITQPLFDGAYNGISSIAFVCHLAYWLGYSKIIFFGVDLYDQAYYWDNGQKWDFLEFDKSTSGWNGGREHLHASAPSTARLMELILPLTPRTKWMVHNPKSLLTKILPVWDINDTSK